MRDPITIPGDAYVHDGRTITALRHENALLRSDAARYQWLRSYVGREDEFPDDLAEPESPEEMDAMIDGEIARALDALK